MQTRKPGNFNVRIYGGFTIMEKLVYMSGGDGKNYSLFRFNLANQTKTEINNPCQHLVHPLSLKIAKKERLVFSCEECGNIKLAKLPPFKEGDTKTSPSKLEFEMAFDKEKIGKMCQGDDSCFYAEHFGTDEILELDCSPIPFRIKKRIRTGVTQPNGMCYVPLPLNMLVVSDHNNRKIQAVSCKNNEIIWKLSGSVDGSKIYPHGLLHSASYNDKAAILVADGENSRVLVLDAGSGSHLQTIGPSDDTLSKMWVSFDLSLYQEQNQDTKWLVVSQRDYPGYVDESSETNLPVQLIRLDLAKLQQERLKLDDIEQLSSHNINLQRAYGFTVMNDTGKLVVNGKRHSSRGLFLFSPQRGGNLREWTREYPCEHGTDDILCLQIAGKEWLCMTCRECKKIRLMDVENDKLTSHEALKGHNFFIMCKGEKNVLYVTLHRNDRVLELDCSTTTFTEGKSFRTGTDRPYDMCYVSSSKCIALSDIHRRQLKFISCMTGKVKLVHDENNHVLIDPGSVTFLPRYDQLLVGDYDNPKILIHDPSKDSVSCQPIRNVPNMGSIRFLCMHDGKIIILYELSSSYIVAYFTIKEKKESEN